MKKVIRPAIQQREEAEYFCDVTGKPMGDNCAATLTIHCGYGSSRDMIEYRMDLSDEGVESIIKLLRSRVYPKTMQSFGYEYSLDGSLPVTPTDYSGPEDQMTFHELLASFPTP